MSAPNAADRSLLFGILAFHLLRRAMQAGFPELKHLKTHDPHLEALRGRADFQ
jgi:hypothetical protein